MLESILFLAQALSLARFHSLLQVYISGTLYLCMFQLSYHWAYYPAILYHIIQTSNKNVIQSIFTAKNFI